MCSAGYEGSLRDLSKVYASSTTRKLDNDYKITKMHRTTLNPGLGLGTDDLNRGSRSYVRLKP